MRAFVLFLFTQRSFLFLVEQSVNWESKAFVRLGFCGSTVVAATVFLNAIQSIHS